MEYNLTCVDCELTSERFLARNKMHGFMMILMGVFRAIRTFLLSFFVNPFASKIEPIYLCRSHRVDVCFFSPRLNSLVTYRYFRLVRKG